jgi:hypothetical protein
MKMFLKICFGSRVHMIMLPEPPMFIVFPAPSTSYFIRYSFDRIPIWVGVVDIELAWLNSQILVT